MKPGQEIRELRITPGADVTRRYADASGDHNPIHTDPEVARELGLPGVILHGLYTMAQVARANVGATGGDPARLKRLAVQFRGMGIPECEITVSGTVRERSNGRVVIDTLARQSGRRIVRNAEAELAVDPD